MMEGTHGYDRAARDPRLPRLRTAHDRAAMQGQVPFTVGGNPTPDESEAQRAHDARQATDATTASLAAQRRESIPTLAEAMAAMPQVTQADGATMPPKLADRGDRGWDGADANRDSHDTVRLAKLVRQMDQMAEDVRMGRQAYSAVRLANTWHAIRLITQSNADRPDPHAGGAE